MYNEKAMNFIHRNEERTVYTLQDLEQINAQKKKRLFVLMLPCLLLLAVLVYSLTIRVQWLTTVVTILLGVVLIFGYTVFLSPLICYARHLNHALHGKTRKTSGYLKEVEEEAVYREGLQVKPMMISIDRIESEEDDRLFYWDANLPLPPWQLGQKITLTSYDKLVTDWEAE